MKVRPKTWIIIWLIITASLLALTAAASYKVDPFFHYHAPDTENYYYPLNNERSQNDGIVKHFSYDGIIAGTSMTGNFRTSEADEIFGAKFIKVPSSGGSFKEINDLLAVALSYNPDVRIIIRGLDYGKLLQDKDLMREDLGVYPDYLYDDDPMNDVKYVFNRDVVFSRVFPMMKENDAEGFRGGVMPFDDYSSFDGKYGKDAVLPEGYEVSEYAMQRVFDEDDREKVIGNIIQNVTDLADAYPDVEFYYFFTPYSAAWWKVTLEQGVFDRQIDAEKTAIEEILKHPNIKLFSFNCLTDITTDLNNYQDISHYGPWVNTMMLRMMHDDECLLTYENYEEYLQSERGFYRTFDYRSLKTQEDYEDDSEASRIITEKYMND